MKNKNDWRWVILALGLLGYFVYLVHCTHEERMGSHFPFTNCTRGSQSSMVVCCLNDQQPRRLFLSDIWTCEVKNSGGLSGLK